MRIINPFRWPELFEEWRQTRTTASIHGLQSLETTLSQVSDCTGLTCVGNALKKEIISEDSQSLISSTASTVPQSNKPRPTSPQPSIQQSHDEGFCDKGIPLPSSSKKLFLSIPASSPTWSSQEYQDRFRFVKGELIRAVVEHAKLRSSGRYVTYSLHMIGTTRDTATPHIVIGCRRCDLGALQDLFYDSAAQRLYCFKDSSWEKLFRSHTEPPKPLFKFFFLHTPHAPIKRYASISDIETVASLSPAYKTLCGALIGYGGRTATVGLVLEICGVLRLLTVGHLFDDYAENSDPFYWIGSYLSRYSPESALFPPHHGSNRSGCRITESHAADSEEESIAAPDKAWDDGIERMRALAQKDLIPGKTIKPPVSLPASAPDLDWAVSEFDQPVLKSPLLNMISPKTSASPVIIKDIALSPQYHGVPVYMVSGINGVRKGYLFEGETYLGPEEGREPCGVWTMIVDSSQRLVPGECGSIVVDQKTFAVYGHVIGSNVLENIYVVPFCQTVQQIQESFNTATVCLPKPESPSMEPVRSVSRANTSRSPGARGGQWGGVALLIACFVVFMSLLAQTTVYFVIMLAT